MIIRFQSLFLLHDCPFTGEHRKEDYAKINPFKVVPVIDDDGFVLPERFVILFSDGISGGISFVMFVHY